MKLTVGTESMNLDLPRRSRPVVQNLGPGDVYIDSAPGVTVDGGEDGEDDATAGIKIVVGQTWEFSQPLAGNESGLSIVSTVADTDVRIMLNGDL